MASIPKLAAQWKIIHDFKPTKFLMGGELPVGLLVDLSSDGEFVLVISFPHPNIRLLGSWLGNSVADMESNQLPNLQEWSRIEIGHVEEEGNFFLTLSVGGQQLGREACQLGRNLTDVKIYSGLSPVSGFIRGLVVLDKQ